MDNAKMPKNAENFYVNFVILNALKNQTIYYIFRPKNTMIIK